MKSAGNDIVALASINKQRTNEFRFYSKILSASEQALYHQPQFTALPFEQYVWLLWSVKESTYKYLKRINPGLVFSPTKIVIEQMKVQEGIRGTVIHGDETLYFQSKITNEWIASVVNDRECFENVCWGIEKIDDESYQHQSEAARVLLLSQLNSNFPGDLKIEKSLVGYPLILNNNTDMNIPASLAHDGSFVSYSFVKSA